MRCALMWLVVAGCVAPPPELPWLHGTTAAVSTAMIAGRNPDDSALACGDAAFARIELTAELTPEPGLEMIRAAPAHGVQVHAASGELLLHAVAEPCRDVRIAAVAVAAGRVLVVDERDAATYVTVLTPGPQRRLDRTYTGVIEDRRGDDVRTGTLAFVGARVIHTDPDGAVRVLGGAR